jgi:hypothetical protein
MNRAGATLLVAALLAPGVLHAQEAGLPSAEAIRERYVQALGGRDAIERQGSRVEYGHLELPAQGMRGTFVLYTAPPNRQLTVIELPGLGSITGGFDGETGWSNNPATGPIVLDGNALNQMRQGVDLHGLLHPERYVTRAETVADTVFAGRRAYRVRVQTVWGESYHEYYDPETGLLAGNTRTQSTAMGDIEATTIIESWRMVDGLKIAERLRQRVMSIEQVFVSDSIIARPVPDTMFVLPPALRALRDAQRPR